MDWAERGIIAETAVFCNSVSAGKQTALSTAACGKTGILASRSERISDRTAGSGARHNTPVLRAGREPAERVIRPKECPVLPASRRQRAECGTSRLAGCGRSPTRPCPIHLPAPSQRRSVDPADSLPGLNVRRQPPRQPGPEPASGSLRIAWLWRSCYRNGGMSRAKTRPHPGGPGVVLRECHLLQKAAGFG